MNMIAMVLQAGLGLSFILLGGAKLAGAAGLRDAFVRLRLPRWLRLGVGALEATLGLAMLVSVSQPILAFPAAIFLAMICAGAVAVHVLRGPRNGWPVAVGLLVASLAVALLQPLGLRIMALPQADLLPVEPVAGFEVLASFPRGVWLESLAVTPDGTIFVSANEGVDLLTGDQTRAQGTVIARAPDGAERTILRLPTGTVAGGLALGPDGRLYLGTLGTSAGIRWIDPTGTSATLAELPQGAWPNGLAFGPGGLLYVADSRLGRIWSVDPAIGTVGMALQDDHLLPRPYLALAPGANGLAFDGDDMIVTVSDRAMVLRFRRAADGTFAPAEVIAIGIPGDDLARDTNGTMYVTTHPYDTVVRIAPDGQRTIVATAEHGIAGATDAAFGSLPGDARTLYVTTDGGAFGGKPDASGQLVALRLP